MAAPTITTSVLTGGSNSHPTTSEEVNGVATDFVSEGIVGSYTNTSGVAPATGAFAVNASGTPDANINISTGVAYVTATPTSQNSQTVRVKCSTSGTLAISSNSSGSTKYDWIYISISASNAANPNVAGDNVATIVASRSTSASTDDGTPPTYGYPIAVVTVANGFTTITNGNIRDLRSNSIVNLGSSSVSSGWLDLGYTPSSITANGNRSYDLVFSSTNLTSTLSNGMRLKLSRLVTAPTQCTDLESGSSQYYSKASPNGMTFTDDFVVSAWVKLESYSSGDQAIASRFNNTSGWILNLNSSGQVLLTGFNAGGANFSKVSSYQSIPLNKWVHIAAQLDMSSFTATTTTSYVMIDGVDVPASVSRAGTNPTALVQAGNLEIGSYNGGAAASLFDGKIAQVAIYSAKVTQATIKASMNQALSGSETSLISAYSFNNSIVDLNANANNLTANGSAVATNADSPFSGGSVGTTEYAIITANAFSTNTTLTVQVPEGYAIPTSGGVSAVSYSTQKVPYGFPAAREKWTVRTHWQTQMSVTPAANVWSAPVTNTHNIPIGDWVLGYKANVQVNKADTTLSIYSTLSTSTSAETDKRLSTYGESAHGSNLASFGYTANVFAGVSLSSATPYYLLVKTSVVATSTLYLRGETVEMNVYAELALL